MIDFEIKVFNKKLFKNIFFGRSKQKCFFFQVNKIFFLVNKSRLITWVKIQSYGIYRKKNSICRVTLNIVI